MRVIKFSTQGGLQLDRGVDRGVDHHSAWTTSISRASQPMNDERVLPFDLISHYCLILKQLTHVVFLSVEPVVRLQQTTSAKAVSRVAAAQTKANCSTTPQRRVSNNHVRGKFMASIEMPNTSLRLSDLSQHCYKTDTACGRPLPSPPPPRTLSNPHEYRVGRNSRCPAHF